MLLLAFPIRVRRTGPARAFWRRLRNQPIAKGRRVRVAVIVVLTSLFIPTTPVVVLRAARFRCRGRLDELIVEQGFVRRVEQAVRIVEDNGQDHMAKATLFCRVQSTWEENGRMKSKWNMLTSDCHVVQIQRVKLPHLKVLLRQFNGRVLIVLIAKYHFLETLAIAIELFCFPRKEKRLRCQQRRALGLVGRSLQLDTDCEGRVNGKSRLARFVTRALDPLATGAALNGGRDLFQLLDQFFGGTTVLWLGRKIDDNEHA